MRNTWKLTVVLLCLGLALTGNVFGQASAINGEIYRNGDRCVGRRGSGRDRADYE